MLTMQNKTSITSSAIVMLLPKDINVLQKLSFIKLLQNQMLLLIPQKKKDCMNGLHCYKSLCGNSVIGLVQYAAHASCMFYVGAQFIMLLKNARQVLIVFENEFV